MSNTFDYENHISAIVQSQFPKFYAEDGQNFIDFVKAYYAWMEVSNNVIDMSRSLLSYRDIDTTPDDFVLFFKNKYLNNIQFTTASNKRLFIKNSLGFYRAKGTPRAVDLFFRLIYGVNADVYLPGEDVFKLSDGQWVKPKYLEVTHTSRNLDYVGQTITGLASGATAFVDRLVRRRINSKYIDIFYISAITGNFLTNENLSIDADLSNIPTVIGSLTTATPVNGSNNFTVGDTVIITSNNGLQAKATVTSTSNTNGEVDFELEEGGWGYSNAAQIMISNSVFGLTNVSVTNTTVSNSFTQFEKINQPLANIIYGSLAGGTFANGDTIEKYAANGTVMGTGTIIYTTATNSTAGSFLAVIGRLSNGSISNLNYVSAMAKPGNTVTATTTTYADKTASANVIGIGANTLLICNNLSGSFTTGETIYQGGPVSQTGNGTLVFSSANSSATVLSLTNFRGIFQTTSPVTGLTSNTTANVLSFSTSIGIVNVGNTFYAGSNSYVYGLSSNTFANVSTISTGNSANVSYTNISYTESIYLNTDIIGSNNSGLVPFLNIVLNGSSGSNLASNAYGFAKKPTGNINSRIFDCLSYTLMNVGVISSLTNINPGSSYSVSPFVVIYEPRYAGLYRLYYTATILNPSRDYTSGEIVEQTITVANSVTLTVNNSAATWQVGEYVYQSNGTANIGVGILQAQTISANIGTLLIYYVSGTGFVTNSTARVNGLTSTALANISAVNTTSYFSNARAIVESQVNNSTLMLKRISTLDLSNTGANLVGLTSGATSTLSAIEPRNPPQSGLNANISANVITSNGVVDGLSIFDSGFGYINAEVATFTSLDGTRSGTTTLELLNQGISEGYYKSTKGFLSNDKYLFDGDFYQEYCVSPETLVLTSDLRWVEAETLRENDKLIGFNENLTGRIKLEPTTVTKTKIIQAKKYKIITDRGTTIVSENHKFVLFRKKKIKNKSKYDWITTFNLTVGDQIVFGCEPWKEQKDYDSAWMAGIFDGEGWCSEKAGHVGVAQNNGIVYDKILKLIKETNVTYYNNLKAKCNVITVAGMWDSLKLLGIFRPMILLAKSEALWNGKTIYTKRKESHVANIIDIQEIGVGDVVTLATSTKTLITDGFLSHNSYQVKSSLPFELYSDILKKVLHLAGTKPFGQVVLSSVTNSYVNSVSYTSNIATANLMMYVSSTSNAQIFSNGETIRQSNGTANIGFGIVRAPMKSIIQIATTNVTFIPGQPLQQPNATSNASFGYVQAVTANSSATNVYVANCTAVFNATANVFGPSKYLVTYLPKIRMKISSVTSGANSTLSFAVGENAFQGTVGSQSANGTVLNANSSVVELRINTGTFANGTTITGQTSNCTANLVSYSNTTFVAGENVYAEYDILSLTNIVNTFSNGEIVYQQARNPNTASISFVNTAIGLVISKNTSALIVTNQFGIFANNATVFGGTSTANATINNINNLINSYATVVSTNSTVVILYQIMGSFSANQTLISNTSNCYANMTTVTVNNSSYTPSAVSNILEIQTVNGYFVANATVNTIVGITSSDSANISAIDYIQL